MFSVVIPFPPSTNSLWQPGKTGKAGKAGGPKFKPTMRSTPAYKAWQTEALWLIKSQHVQPVKGRYILYLLLPKIDARHRDIDNLLKASSDIVKHAHLIEDDHLCESAHLFWVAKGEPPRVIVEGCDEEDAARANLRAGILSSLA